MEENYTFVFEDYDSYDDQKLKIEYTIYNDKLSFATIPEYSPTFIHELTFEEFNNIVVRYMLMHKGNVSKIINEVINQQESYNKELINKLTSKNTELTNTKDELMKMLLGMSKYIEKLKEQNKLLNKTFADEDYLIDIIKSMKKMTGYSDLRIENVINVYDKLHKKE